MARMSGTGYGGTAGSSYNIYLEYTLLSQDVAANTSRIRVKFWGQASNPRITAWRGSPSPYSITANGDKRSGTVEIDFRNQRVMTFGSEDFTIKHNSDGNKTIDIAGSFTISGVSSIRGGDISGTWKLPTIPRGSTPTLSSSSITLGGKITAYTNSKNSSFTFDMYAILGNRQAKFANRVYTSQVFDITAVEAWAKEIPNATSRVGIIRMRTYNGNTLIGSEDVNLTFVVPDTYEFKPKATSLAVGIYGDGADKSISEFVQGISRIQASFTAEAGMGASIVTQQLILGGTPYSGTSATSGHISGAGTRTIKAVVKDSRGRIAEQETTIEVYPYAPPKLNEFEVKRRTNSTIVDMIRSGSWSRVNGKNTLNVRIERAPSGGSYAYVTQTNYTSTTETFTANTTNSGVSELASYDFKIILTDTLGRQTTAIVGIGTSEVPMSWGKKGIGVGKVTEEIGVLEVGGLAIFDGDIQIKEDLTAKKGTFQGDLNLLGNLRKNGSLVDLSKYGVEYGSNSNGYYVQFPEGLLVCFDYKTFSNMSVNRAIGSFYESTDDLIWTFPREFADRPAVTASNNNTAMRMLAMPLTIRTYQYEFKMLSPVTQSTGNKLFTLSAIGRWK